MVEGEGVETECSEEADVVNKLKLQVVPLPKSRELFSVLVAALHHLMH